MIALEVVARATLLLLLALAAHAVTRRHASAATRHLIWTSALLGLLTLPALSILLPVWRIPAPVPAWVPTEAPAMAAVGEPPGAEIPTPASVGGAGEGAMEMRQPDPGVGLSWTVALLLAYAAGVLLLLARLGVERWAVRRLASRADPVRDDDWLTLMRDARERMGIGRPVALLRSRLPVVPMTWGTRRPAVLIPSNADEWSDERRRAVLLHELAHVARGDCLVQSFAALATALYWFHPGVWWAARSLRMERELACDDRAIGAGIAPRAYAGHLLEIARSLQPARGGAVALSMARPSQLEVRLRAALDRARSRSAPGPLPRVLVGWIAAVLLVSVASAELARLPVELVPPPAGPAPAAVLTPEAAPAGEELVGDGVPVDIAAASALADEPEPPPPDPSAPGPIRIPEPRLAGGERAPSAAGIIRVAPVAARPIAEPRIGPERSAAREPLVARRRPDLIAREEIETHLTFDLYTLVRTARSPWLRSHPSSFGGATGVQVYLDGQRMGGPDALRSISAAGVLYIQHYSPAEAASRWGLDHDQGAIYVATR